ncbi:predicted protein [Arabidopsis lyrata subsp. lyrata]|uniref:Predicted protein n=1 Tax=Arabidopsis lyrata subsp. lyrata TaxID=81972 RepID=D7MWX7_ARALL|nr:predicted protein [Arabidopsis lyrata subsp. lyrata]
MVRCYGTSLISTEPFTISSNKTIVSHNEVFELGIFKPEYSSPDEDRWYLGIWYKKISERTYVWVANRDNPLSNPIGTIRVWNSNILLSDQSNTVVWSTSITEESERSSIVAELLNEGNLVLRQSNNKDGGNKVLWQSFDFPTNTLLPGMKLGWKLRTGRYSFLTSWKDLTDPSSGEFTYQIEAARRTRGFPALFLWSGRSKVKRVSPWDGVVSLGVPRNQPLTYITFTLTANKEEVSFSFQTSDSKYTSRLTLTSVQQLMWNETSLKWDLLWHSVAEECDIYGICGPYSYCDILMACKCMRCFEPKDQEAWALENKGDGCVRKAPLSCSDDKLIATPTENMSGENIVENTELPLLSFETISRATDDFSVFNKLGEGGFGVVYKGILDGQKIAVKRLSNTSDQGTDEFKNELKLITKVEHLNLVKIFGYCINGEENGYMSPEYSEEGTYSVKSDVYSFGVLVLEILSGKRNRGFAEANDGLSLLSYAWKKWSKGEWACVIDPMIDPSSDEVKRCFQIGLRCVQGRQEDRPVMSSVLLMLLSQTEIIPEPNPPGFYGDL